MSPNAAVRLPLRLAVQAMATRFELVLGGDDPVRLRAVGEAAMQEIQDCEAAISPFARSSQIARVNQLAHARPVRVDALTMELLQHCRELHASSGGAFDITVGPLLRALGFRGAPRGDDRAIAAARSAVGMQHLELDVEASTVQFLRPGMALDLGAIGKGFALDLAAAVLCEHGVQAALLHGGTSTVLALGPPPGLPAWRIAIGPWEAPPIANLVDGALSVSAGHGRQVDGVGHVLDPMRGTPVDDDCAAAAVLASSATVADGWSTALLVAAALAPPADTAFLLARRGAAAMQWHGRGERLSTCELPATATPLRS